MKFFQAAAPSYNQDAPGFKACVRYFLKTEDASSLKT